jgi:hypothetical protein
VEKPQSADIFEVRIESPRAEDRVREVGQTKIPIFRLRQACRLDPEPERPNHVLADTEIDHGGLLVGERRRIGLDRPISLRKPRVTAGEGLVS